MLYSSKKYYLWKHIKQLLVYASVISDSFGFTIARVESTSFPIASICIHLPQEARRVSDMILDKKQLW